MQIKKRTIIITGIVLIAGTVGAYYVIPSFAGITYNSTVPVKVDEHGSVISEVAGEVLTTPVEQKITSSEQSIAVMHLKTPVPVKALYMSSWVASGANSRAHVVHLIDTTEANAVVIDIKDATGKVSFIVTDPIVAGTNSPENRIRDIASFIDTLHKKNIYVIGRISTFQDPYLAKVKPEWAIQKKSDGTVWKDKKGLAFLDPANKNVWTYVEALAKASYAKGFDEINFDYVRYPSDGDIKNINYKLSEGRTRADNIEAFFKALSLSMKQDTAIPISADLFGLTNTANDDLGIGQVLVKALPYFDYIAPMVYPSHYASGYDGIKKPALYPYQVVFSSMKGGVARTATINVDKKKLRPWLQDFDLGATYTPAMIQSEMKAVYDTGLDSWMMWDPRNQYTPSAYLLEKQA